MLDTWWMMSALCFVVLFSCFATTLPGGDLPLKRCGCRVRTYLCAWGILGCEWIASNWFWLESDGAKDAGKMFVFLNVEVKKKPQEPQNPQNPLRRWEGMVRSQAFRLAGLAAFFSSWMGRLEQSKSWWISLKRGEVILNLSPFLRIMRVGNPYATIVWIRLPWRGCHLLLQGGNTTQPNTCGIHVHRGSTCGDAQGADCISCGGKRWVEAQGSELRQPKHPKNPP